MNLPASDDALDPPALRPLRRGVVAAIQSGGRWLIIRRAQGITAPGKYCFPGGGIETHETQEQALVRELQEELQLVVRPIRCLWQSRTRWGVELWWWQAELVTDAPPLPNQQEVAEVAWLHLEEILALDELLDSNRDFFDALRRGEICF